MVDLRSAFAGSIGTCKTGASDEHREDGFVELRRTSVLNSLRIAFPLRMIDLRDGRSDESDAAHPLYSLRLPYDPRGS